MSFYGADIEQLRTFGRQLDAGAESFESVRRLLQSSVTGAGWPGPDGTQFRAQWSSELSPSLAAVAATLHDAAIRVRANADAQERTSTDDGTATRTFPGAKSGVGRVGAVAPHAADDASGTGDSGDPGDSGMPKVTVTDTQKSRTDNSSLGSDATEGRDRKVSGSYAYDPATGESTYTGKGSLSDWFKTTDGSKISFGVNGGAQYTTGEHSADGFTTYTSKADVSIGVEGGVSNKTGTGVSGGFSTGLTSEYTVKVPDSAGDVDPGSINPFDPSSMPIGSSVTMNGGDYTKTDLNAAFRHIAIESSVKDADGVSSVVERVDADTVRVTAGPTEAIVNRGAAGVDFDGAKLLLANTTTLGGASLHSAEFDLSTAAGQAAYDRYLATGEIPSDPSTGISGITSIERTTFDSTTKLSASTPFGGAEWEVGQNTGSKVLTTYPDGSSEQLLTANYGDRGPFHLSQSFDASGAEDASARSYTYEVTVDDLHAQYLNSGDWFPQYAVPGHISAGDTVTLTFTESQLDGLAHQGYVADPLSLPAGDRFDEQYSAVDLAALFAREYSDAEMIERISEIYQSRP